MFAKVHFIVSSGMTKYDIKNYLEKIYKVPVADVRTLNKMGKTRQNAFGSYIVKDDDYKMAYVTLPPGMMTVVKLRQGSGKDGQGMALKAKGLKA